MFFLLNHLPNGDSLCLVHLPHNNQSKGGVSLLRNTIKFNLVVIFSLIILIPFLVLSLYLIQTESQKINSRTFAALKQNCKSVADAAQREIEQMNMVSTDIAYSYLIKDSYSQYLENQNNYEQTKSLYDLLSNTIGPNRPVDQVNIYTKVDTVIAVGLYSNIYNRPVVIQPWYAEAKENNGGSVVNYDGLDPLLARFTTDVYGKRFLSLSRKYFDRYNNVQGYIEVKESLRQVLSQAIGYQSVYGEELYVFDQKGELLFPLGLEDLDYVFTQTQLENSESDFSLISNASTDSYATAFTLESGLHFVIAIQQDALFMPVNRYINSVLFLTFASLVFAFALSYFAANRITVPIQRIYNEMQHISLDGYMRKTPLKTKTIELNVLYDSFIDMQHKLVDSLNKQLLLKNQEMQSKMLALQSQMNPHFLFNSLQTIQSMADASMNDEIVVMCQSMSNILRYISSDTNTTVALGDEITYTDDFLQCMSIRYSNDLYYSFDFPEQMRSVLVPKLCIQPLVENSMRYCTTKLPPYRIRISGAQENGAYTITVTDNGPGFSEEALALIAQKIREIDETGLLPSLEIKGMGLMNIYLRFKILYGSGVVFKIQNLEGGGTSITIGGVIHE